MVVKNARVVAKQQGVPAILAAILAATSLWDVCRGDDWSQFRGPGARGIASSAVPLAWSQTENLRWKTPLPGPGSSSPIVHGERVFVTS